MAVWAVYGQGRERAALAPQVGLGGLGGAGAHPGRGQGSGEESGGAPLVVREYAALQAIPWWVEAPVQE